MPSLDQVVRTTQLFDQIYKSISVMFFTMAHLMVSRLFCAKYMQDESLTMINL